MASKKSPVKYIERRLYPDGTIKNVEVNYEEVKYRLGDLYSCHDKTGSFESVVQTEDKIDNKFRIEMARKWKYTEGERERLKKYYETIKMYSQ